MGSFEHLSPHTSFPEGSQRHCRVKTKFRGMWARIPGYPGQTAWSFSRCCSWKRLWTYPLLVPWQFHLSPEFLGIFHKKVCSLSIKPVSSHMSSFIVTFKISLHTTCQVFYSKNKRTRLLCLGTIHKPLRINPWMVRNLSASSDKLLSCAKRGPPALKGTRWQTQPFGTSLLRSLDGTDCKVFLDFWLRSY